MEGQAGQAVRAGKLTAASRGESETEQASIAMEPQLNQEVIKTAAEHDGPIETDAVIVGAGPWACSRCSSWACWKSRRTSSTRSPTRRPVHRAVPRQADLRHPRRPGVHRQGTDGQPAQADRAFGATFHLGQTVSVVQKQADGRFFVETSKGTRFLTKTIFIAAGVGAFEPRTLKVDGLDKFDGTQLFYRVRNPADFAGKNLVIVGGGDSALDWALNFTAGNADGNRTRPRASS